MSTLDPRDELRQLLPWYENGTLRADERDAVRGLLATDLEANRQRRELRALRDVLANDPTLATNMALNLTRLQSQMGPAPTAPVVRMTLQRLALAALVMLALGLTMFFAGMRVGSYHTLTASSDYAPADAELIRVNVDAGVDAATLLRLAADPQARVVNGPSKHGVATLVVPRAHAQQVMARLRADPQLRFVAPVPR